MARRKKGICGYCGDYSEDITVEHIFPDALFHTPRNHPRPITIDACGLCNGEKAKCDGEFRDLLIMSVGSIHHPEVKPIVEGKFARASVRKNGRRPISKVALALESAEVNYTPTSDGISVVSEVTAEIDPEPTACVMGHIAFGVINHTSQFVLTKSHGVHITDLENEKFEKMLAIVRAEDAAFSGIEGLGVAEWGLTYSGAGPSTSCSAICIVRFYGARAFMALVAPKIPTHDSTASDH